MVKLTDYAHTCLSLEEVAVYARPNVMKPFKFVVYEFYEKARVFFSGRPLQPSLMLVSKARNLAN
jgi:hypothetical protein